MQGSPACVEYTFFVGSGNVDTESSDAHSKICSIMKLLRYQFCQKHKLPFSCSLSIFSFWRDHMHRLLRSHLFKAIRTIMFEIRA